jgi:hypothetical protein
MRVDDRHLPETLAFVAHGLRLAGELVALRRA